uniref:Reverse transcriptase Ty1/copia-type domain-containing protein n=1 Tax=Rhizophora mucronata TaxID=61149 RepID=A0A2P2J041_RHIMU
MLLFHRANFNWSLQLNVKNAFFNDDLEEKTFTCPLPSFENIIDRNKVCKLKKTL